MKDTWLTTWEPENPEFWKETGSKIAWRTLTITTLALILSFASWFMMSGIVVRIPQIGFEFSTMQLFWLAAMPGLAGGTLRILHTFMTPIYGTRHVITVTTFLKLIPVIGIGLAVMNPNTPFWVFMLLAFSAGFGGGDFSSYMPSTRFFFPKRLQGTALGIQAGIGNFGVSLTQFLTPWIIGFAIVGSSQTMSVKEVVKPIWLQNAAFVCTVPHYHGHPFVDLSAKRTHQSLLQRADGHLRDEAHLVLHHHLCDDLRHVLRVVCCVSPFDQITLWGFSRCS